MTVTHQPDRAAFISFWKDQETSHSMLHFYVLYLGGLANFTIVVITLWPLIRDSPEVLDVAALIHHAASANCHLTFFPDMVDADCTSR